MGGVSAPGPNRPQVPSRSVSDNSTIVGLEVALSFSRTDGSIKVSVSPKNKSGKYVSVDCSVNVYAYTDGVQGSPIQHQYTTGGSPEESFTKIDKLSPGKYFLIVSTYGVNPTIKSMEINIPSESQGTDEPPVDMQRLPH